MRRRGVLLLLLLYATAEQNHQTIAVGASAIVKPPEKAAAARIGRPTIGPVLLQTHRELFNVTAVEIRPVLRGLWALRARP
jgi:hypothetical protein